MADSKLHSEPWFTGDRSEERKPVSINNNKGSLAELSDNLDDIVDELSALLLKKHKDYGPKNISQSPGGAINGLRVRMHDKLARINHLYESGATPENEPFEDAWKDLANYAIIGLLVLRQKWGE